MTKYFTVEFWTDKAGTTKTKTMRTWTETINFLRNIFNDFDMISIRYVGDR